MSCWLRLINLDTWRSSVIELDGDRTLLHDARLTFAGGEWAVHAARSGRVVSVNGQVIRTHALSHGDAFIVGNMMHVFLSRPMAVNDDALIAHLDERADDDGAVKVWADWLLDHGDALGEHLLGKEPQQWVLEGVATDALELTWRHGLLTRAVLRCTPASPHPVELLARLLSTRVARWLRELIVDCSTWSGSSFDTQRNTGSALRVLLEGPRLPALRRLGFGVVTEPFEPPGLLMHLKSRLAARFPLLESNLEVLFLPTPYPTLEIVQVPSAVDFHAPHAREGRLPLTNGAWVGSSSPGQLRLLTQGVHRGGVVEHFLIERTAARLSLLPVGTVTLNQRPARETRLLDGDVIEADGAQFRFRA